MALSIKSTVVEQLARESARLSGESLTDTIRHALESQLLRLRRRRTAPNLEDEILSISRHCAALPDLDKRSADEILGYRTDGTLDGR